MAILVADVKGVLSTRCGATLAMSGLDGTATSSLFLDGIASSARELGVTLASPLTVVDADLVGVTQSQISQLLDVAELRTMETALNSFTQCDTKYDTEEIDAASVGRLLADSVKRLSAYVLEKYGIGQAAPTLGNVDLGFQETAWPWCE